MPIIAEKAAIDVDTSIRNQLLRNELVICRHLNLIISSCFFSKTRRVKLYEGQ
jgi:hypothetical protein